jgi:hypothetical protein
MTVGPYRDDQYVVLPKCVDPYGHDFVLSPGTTRPVCRKCGLMRTKSGR